MQRNGFAPAGPEYGIRRNGETFGMTSLSLKEAEEMAASLSKDGAKIEIFVMGTGQTVSNKIEQADEVPPAGTKDSLILRQSA